MSGLRFVGACMAATLLVLSSQETMGQGLLPMEPQPFDDIMSPYPLGPLQKFGDWSGGSQARSTQSEPARRSRPQQAHVARSGRFQAQRRPNRTAEPRQIVVRSSASRHEGQRGVAGSGSALSFARSQQERRPPGQFCFPSSTIHFQQNERDDCNGGAPAYKGRFEELLGE
jgi:hypothetical protein